MIAVRDRNWRRFGAALTGLALGLQLMLSSLGLVIASAVVDPADPLYGRALCLAGESRKPQPAHPAAPAHNHFAFCCLWHQLPGVEPAAALPAQPVAYLWIDSGEPSLATFNPGPQYRPSNARAPPTLA
jgi:hypothetical protein